jgi:hypothetical protein
MGNKKLILSKIFKGATDIQKEKWDELVAEIKKRNLTVKMNEWPGILHVEFFSDKVSSKKPDYFIDIQGPTVSSVQELIDYTSEYLEKTAKVV